MAQKTSRLLSIAAVVLLGFLLGTRLPAFQSGSNPGDWPEWRGPARDGVSKEKNLPSHWSPAGENLAWKADIGGRAGPVRLGGPTSLQKGGREGESMQ